MEKIMIKYVFSRVILAFYNLNKKIYNYVYQEVNRKRFIFDGNGKNNVLIRENASIDNRNRKRSNIKIGSKVIIDGMIQSTYGKGEIEIGEQTYIGPNTRVWAFQSVKIGKNVLISHKCNIFDSNCHPIDPKVRNKDYMNLLT